MKQPICANCGQPFIKFRSTQKACSALCALEMARVKAERKEKRQRAVEKKAQLDKLKTYSQRLQDAKRIFQKWIRKRDKDLPCVSCGSNQSEIWDGGHFKKAEMFAGVMFDERNVHKQCRKCNYYLDGNELAYRERLVQRFGSEWVERLESDANATRYYKWTDEELSEIKDRYKC